MNGWERTVVRSQWSVDSGQWSGRDRGRTSVVGCRERTDVGGYSAFMGHNGGFILIVFPFTATSFIRDESTRIQDINLSHVSSTISSCFILK